MRTVSLAAIVLTAAATAGAQFNQYTAPGSLGEEQIPTQERLKAAMEDARYHLGPLTFAPWLAFKDLGYVNNVYGTTTNLVSDVTATAGAGALAYLPIGHRMTLGMYALPEYVWWKDLANRRGWNGAVGAGLFGYFNRMTLEIQAGGSRHQQYASSEVEVPVNLEDRHVSALVEVQLVGRVSLFGRAGVNQWRYNLRGLTPDLAGQLIPLERDEKQAGGGIRYHFTEKISIGLGVTQYTTDFIHQANARSNSGLAPTVELNVQTAHIRVSVNGTALDLKPNAGSDFAPYSGTNGDFQIAYTPSGRLELVYYGARNLTYSVQSGASYYLDERTGIGLASPLGWRATGRVFWETGRSAYVATAAGGALGADRFTGYGGTIGLRVGRSISLVVGGSRSEYTSPVGDRNRTVAQVQATLQFQSGKGQWW